MDMDRDSSDCKSVCVHSLYTSITTSLILFYILIWFFTASSEADENTSLENITEEEEPNEDDPVQTDTAADTDGRRTGIIGTIYYIHEYNIICIV